MDNGRVTSPLHFIRTPQVTLLKSPSHCHCVTGGRLPTDSGPISFRQEQMRQKIELKPIQATMTYCRVQRPFQTEIC